MKIKGTGSDLSQDAVQILTGKKAPQGNKTSANTSSESDGVDVNVGLGALIGKEFNSTKLDAERRKKVEDLKEQIRQGKYNPDSQAVAAALGEEISLSILTEGSAARSSD